MNIVKTTDYKKLISEVKDPIGNIVFIHGFGDKYENSLNWRKKFNKFNFYSINLPGHGESKFSSFNELDFNYFSDVIYSFILELKLNKFILIGHSFGASIAISLSKEFEKKITYMILETPIVDPDLLNFNLIKKIIPDNIDETKFIFNKLIYNFDNRFDNEEEKNKFLNDEYNDLSARKALKTLFVIEKVSTWLKSIQKNILENKINTLVLLGQYDEITPIIKTTSIFSKNQNFKIEVIPNCAHIPFYEDPKKCSSIIFDFIGNKNTTKK